MDKSTKDFLITAGSIFIGAWVLKKLLIDKKYFKCPRCNYPVNNEINSCPNCGQPLIWGGKQW